ncbi:hypothetical protein SMSP2_00665 [Limihaloglobus sulfuriphilus]|uniref:Uncharacterized protein n=1 Tax=Limihaloglobus sulfuriphilus TaxID=1851148 RepID=A0A1Q2MCA7_9BACT|nr:hypothetical protein [Limihaloglobus sulfuriphilus]AQQ70321.1 hypothetical protein SMSP2_00665 [Limihaloglobus sulfuriphilus]
MKIENKIFELAQIASRESMPTLDVSESVMNTLAGETAGSGNLYSLRFWFTAASIAASFITVLLAYKMHSAGALTEIVDLVAWAV